jgi:hypothetical protein
VDARWPRAETEARLAALLADRASRARWRRWSGLDAVAALLLAVGLSLAVPGAGPVAAQGAPVPAPEVMAPGTAVTGLPSGLALTLQEVLLEPQEGGATWARFRFLAPDLAGDTPFARVEPDFPHLCETVALPALAGAGQSASQIVISLSAAAVPFGQSDPAVVQYFEAFRPEGARCIWEVF